MVGRTSEAGVRVLRVRRDGGAVPLVRVFAGMSDERIDEESGANMGSCDANETTCGGGGVCITMFMLMVTVSVRFLSFLYPRRVLSIPA